MKIYISKDEARTIANTLRESTQRLMDQLKTDKPAQKISEVCEEEIANRQKLIHYIEEEIGGRE